MNHFGIVVGDRVKLVHMSDDPNPIPEGSVGTVRLITDLHFRDQPQVQFIVAWDSGRSLSCVCPPDILVKYQEEEQQGG